MHSAPACLLYDKEPNTMPISPCIKVMAGELRAIVGLNNLRQAPDLPQPFQNSYYTFTTQAGIHFQCQTLAAVTVDDAQSAKAPATTQRIADEVSAQRAPVQRCPGRVAAATVLRLSHLSRFLCSSCAMPAYPHNKNDAASYD